MIGFHIQYDFLTTVPRTWKGHLPHFISVTVEEHPSLWQQKKDRGEKKRGFFFFPPQPGWHPSWPVTTCWSARKDGKICAKGAKCKKFVLSLICLCYIIFKSLNIYTLIFCFILKSASLCSLLHFPSSALVVCPSLVGITSVLLSVLKNHVSPCFAMLASHCACICLSFSLGAFQIAYFCTIYFMLQMHK